MQLRAQKLFLPVSCHGRYGFRQAALSSSESMNGRYTASWASKMAHTTQLALTYLYAYLDRSST